MVTLSNRCTMYIAWFFNIKLLKIPVENQWRKKLCCKSTKQHIATFWHQKQKIMYLISHGHLGSVIGVSFLLHFFVRDKRHWCNLSAHKPFIFLQKAFFYSGLKWYHISTELIVFVLKENVSWSGDYLVCYLKSLGITLCPLIIILVDTKCAIQTSFNNSKTMKKKQCWCNALQTKKYVMQ